MRTKKCLIVVPGVQSPDHKNKKDKPINYMRLEENSVFLEDYDKVIYFDTELTFDKSLTAKIADKLDFIPYFLNKKMRKEVCTRLNNTITQARTRYDSVDILAHSLGTIISLECGKKKSPVNIDNMVCLQSPISNFFYGWYVSNHVKKYKYNLNVGMALFTYNKKDWRVANTKKNLNYLKDEIKTIGQINAGSGHNWKKALYDLIVILDGVISNAKL